MAERMSSFIEVPLADIKVPSDRLRPISEAKVSALVQVIEEGLFLGAITVRRSGKTNTLIDGAHRLEAMRRLGRETIRADVLDCSASEARRLEVTGNLTAGMTPIQDAIFLGVYQDEYEKLHPETKRGVAGALAKNGLQRANLHVAELIAETRQITPAQVRRIIAAGRALTRDERQALQSVSHKIPMNEVEKLGKIGDQQLRARAVEALLEGKKVAAAIRAAKAETGGEAPAKDPVEEAFTTLSKAWARTSKEAKRRFVAAHFEELGLLGAEEEEARFEAERQELLAEIARNGGPK